MCDLRTVVDDVIENPIQPIAFYDYPRLYHFFYSRVQVDQPGVDLLHQFQPHNTTRVLDLACGTGLLLTRIEDEYQTVVGVDIDSGMLDLARYHTETATLHQADITEWSATEDDQHFDAAIMVGALFHLTGDDDLQAFAENVFESVRVGGAFITSFIPRENVTMESIEISKTVESDRYRVEQVNIAVPTSVKGHATNTYRYEIRDKVEDRTVTFGTVTRERWHGISEVQETFISAGFTHVEVLDTESPKVILHTRR